MNRRFTLEDLQRKGFSVAGDKAAKENKIRGAQKTEIDGVKFASKLELYLYNLLKIAKIRFDFQVVYELQPEFRFHGAKVQSIKVVPDFYLPDHDIIIDTKGFQLADNKIKFKMLKNKLVSDGKSTTIELPRTKEECEALVNKLLNKKI